MYGGQESSEQAWEARVRVPASGVSSFTKAPAGSVQHGHFLLDSYGGS